MEKYHEIERFEAARICYVRVTLNLCTPSVQHSCKVHSVSVYFSAMRKIEKKGSNKKNIHPAEVYFLMLAFTVHVGQIESL